MNCHRYVHSAARPAEGAPAAAPVSVELQKLYSAVGFDPVVGDYATPHEGRPIAWIKVHDLPDFVAFDHSRHVGAGVACRRCHGPVESMERVAQVSDLSMGWCLACHRAVDAGRIPELDGRSASTDCAACHY
jgi:hypothetical protein